MIRSALALLAISAVSADQCRPDQMESSRIACLNEGKGQEAGGYRSKDGDASICCKCIEDSGWSGGYHWTNQCRGDTNTKCQNPCSLPPTTAAAPVVVKKKCGSWCADQLLAPDACDCGVCGSFGGCTFSCKAGDGRAACPATAAPTTTTTTTTPALATTTTTTTTAATTAAKAPFKCPAAFPELMRYNFQNWSGRDGPEGTHTWCYTNRNQEWGCNIVGQVAPEGTIYGTNGAGGRYETCPVDATTTTTTTTTTPTTTTTTTTPALATTTTTTTTAAKAPFKCPAGYDLRDGDFQDVRGFGFKTEESKLARSVAECAALCFKHDQCKSFQFSPTGGVVHDRMCQIHKQREPTLGKYKDYGFCAAAKCPAGYDLRDGALQNIGGFGFAVKESTQARSVAACARLCSKHDACKSFKFSPTDRNRKCIINEQREPTSGQYRDYVFCAAAAATAATTSTVCSHTTCSFVELPHKVGEQVITIMQVIHNNEESTCSRHETIAKNQYAFHGAQAHCAKVNDKEHADYGKCKCHKLGFHPNGTPVNNAAGSFAGSAAVHGDGTKAGQGRITEDEYDTALASHQQNSYNVDASTRDGTDYAAHNGHV